MTIRRLSQEAIGTQLRYFTAPYSEGKQRDFSPRHMLSASVMMRQKRQEKLYIAYRVTQGHEAVGVTY